METVAAVIPCYNEAARLNGPAFAAAVTDYPWLRLVFVNDGSGDATAAVLDRLCAAHPGRMQALHLRANQGKAAAVRQGFLAAMPLGTTHLAYLDADLSTPMNALPGLLARATACGALVVMGSRVRLLGNQVERNPARHYLGRVFATLASLSLGLPVYDTQCGAKLFVNDAVLAKVFAEPFAVNWTFDVEILSRYLIALGGANTLPDGAAALVEHPLDSWTDVRGSKVRPWDFFTGIRELSRIRALVKDPGYRKLFEG